MVMRLFRQVDDATAVSEFKNCKSEKLKNPLIWSAASMNF